MSDEPERRRSNDRLAAELGYLRADFALFRQKLDRMDERTERMEKALFYGNGRPALVTQVAVLEGEIERRAGRAGAAWGTAVSAGMTAIAGAIWAILSGPPHR